MATNIYTGFHAVEERVRKFSQDKTSKDKFLKEKNLSLNLKIFYSKPGPRIKKILDAAQKAEISCEQKSDSDLDLLVKDLPEGAKEHRGIVLCVEGEKIREKNEVDLEQWLKTFSEKLPTSSELEVSSPQVPLSRNKAQTSVTVVMLDNVTDPHNIGAVLRSCDQFGASLLIVPEHKSTANVRENEIIARTSAGASAWVNIATVNNLNRALEQLKNAGFWIYGADANGEPLQNTKFPKKVCIVMGSEGCGINRLVKENCDSIVSIPTCGKLDSLNVSVAAGILLYERHRQEI